MEGITYYIVSLSSMFKNVVLQPINILKICFAVMYLRRVPFSGGGEGGHRAHKSFPKPFGSLPPPGHGPPFAKLQLKPQLIQARLSIALTSVLAGLKKFFNDN